MVGFRVATALVVVGALALGGCGDGEDRPGDVSSESDSGSVSASGTGSASASSAGHGDDHEHHEGGADFSKSEADTDVHATAKDFAFELPETVKGKKVFFEVTNDGQAEHEFLVRDAGGQALGEIEPFKKGETKTLALELEPGTYTVVCLVEEGEKTHEELGMKASFTVE